jgi:ATP-dependent Clp protease ATP-binding subunit ClpA
MKRIVDIQLKHLQKRLEERKIVLKARGHHGRA